ncbi:MAG: hypothetical protein Q7J98_01280, partial [Kiritimatiellia bacterium]|nr:hypothetical protein [Kiritimatiellia bacterium]
MQSLRTTLCMLAFGLVSWTAAHGATTRYVATNGAAVSPFTNWPNAATTITGAFAVAVDGDTILVSNGVYTAGVGPSIGFTLRGVNGAGVTIIDRGGAGSCILVYASGAGNPIRISGFTLRNGNSVNSGGLMVRYDRSTYVNDCIISNNVGTQNGGGVRSFTDSGAGLLVMSNCWIVNNIATNAGYGAGGGVYWAGTASTAQFYNCVISNNQSIDGGGLYFYSGNGLVESCNISSNSATSAGGGIRFGTAVTINNCTIDGNVATSAGGGICAKSGGSWSYISNSIIRNNSGSRAGSSGTAGGGIWFYQGNCKMTGCLVTGNRSLAGDGYGAGLGFEDTTYTSVVQNTTIVSNTSAYRGGGL